MGTTNNYIDFSGKHPKVFSRSNAVISPTTILFQGDFFGMRLQFHRHTHLPIQHETGLFKTK